MEIQQLTGKGPRETNQDLICIDRLPSGASLFLIADGMGGYERGDDAARVISESIVTFLEHTEAIHEPSIHQALQQANEAIQQFNTKNNIKSGATIGGVIVEKDVAHVFWIGDVMIYHVNSGQVLFKTKSHTLVNRLSESKRSLNKDSLEKYRHIVTRSISGKTSELKMGYRRVSFSQGDWLVLCSDGVHQTLSIEELLLFFNQLEGWFELEEQLLLRAEDNYSIIILTNQ